MPGGYSSPPEWNAQSYGILHVVGRLREGVLPEQAAAELSAIQHRHEADYPQFLAVQAQDSRIRFVPSGGKAEWPDPPSAAGVVVRRDPDSAADLHQSGRAAIGARLGRTSELALRAALGAARGRLIAPDAGGEPAGGRWAAGRSVSPGAFWLVNVLRRLEALQLPSPDAVQVNGQVLLFAAALTLVAGVLAGLAPALLASRPDLHRCVKTGSRSIARGWRGGMRSALVAAEVAMALVLLLGAGLLLRSMYRLLTVPLGIQPTRVLSLRLRLPRERYREDPQQAAFADELLRRVRACPAWNGPPSPARCR